MGESTDFAVAILSGRLVQPPSITYARVRLSNVARVGLKSCGTEYVLVATDPEVVTLLADGKAGDSVTCLGRLVQAVEGDRRSPQSHVYIEVLSVVFRDKQPLQGD